MLAGLRKSLKSWAAGLVLLIALVAIVVTGFGTGGSGGLGSLAGGGSPSESLATVEGRAVTASEASDAVNRQFAAARREQPTLDMGSFLRSGAFEQIVNQLIVGAAIQSFAEAQGFVISQEMIDRQIVAIPQFRNFSGRFDQATFRQMLQSQNISEARFRDDIARGMLVRQLLGPVSTGAQSPQGVARAYADLLLERRRGTIGIVPTQLTTAGINPSDAEVAQYYRANQSSFVVPERRVIRYAVLGMEQVAQAGAATDAEIARVYRSSQALYGPRETRTLQHLVLQDQRAAQQAVQQLRGGASFADVTSRLGFAASDLTFPDQNRASFARQAPAEVARVAFSTPQGNIAGPIRADGAFHIVRVERVTAIPARSLETVRGDIAAFIERRKRTEALGDLIQRVEERLADGANFEEVARAERLTIVATPPLTAAGQPVGGQPWQAPPELARLLTPAFEIDAEELDPVVEELEANARYALLGVERVEPAAPPPLGQIRDQVRAALIQRRALERARAIADGIVRKINGGMPAARAFAESGTRLPPPESTEMRRLDISRAGQQVPPPLLALFSIPQGRARVIPAPSGAGWFVVFHERRTPGDSASVPQLVQTTRTEFTRTAGEELAQQFARAIELQSGVTRNDEAIRRARQQMGGGAGAE